MVYKKKSFLFFLIICTKLFAQPNTSEFGLQSDNDAYLARGSDKYYTDGLFFYYRHALKIKPNSNLQNKILGFEIGQKIFNPHTGDISFPYGFDNLATIDRPFAAYLNIGSNMNFLYRNESSIKLTAEIGVVGPNAFGKQIQTFVHHIFGFYHPQGWEYQIANNYELNLSAEYNRLLVRGSLMDVSLTSHANLGNGFIGTGIGSLIRLGYFNQLFNSISTQSTVIQSNTTAPLHYHELFFYYKPQLDFVAYDATVQGSLFGAHKSNSIEITQHPENFVLNNQLGISYSSQRFGVDVAAVFHTKDVKEMISAHQWGTITFLWRTR